MAFPPSLWPSRLFDQNFGMCITPNDFILPFYTYNNYYRPWKWSMQSVKDFGSTINNEKASFKVTLDVQHFKPEELNVKVANNQIIVEGKHEERKDEHGFISRQFTRRYTLPSNCMSEDVTSNLSSDGVLTVIANKKALPKNETIVPIKLCKSCPLKEAKTVVTTEQRVKSDEIKSADLSKKNTQLMLKEDHCCLLLKPELLREAASESTEIIVEKKKQNTEKDKLKSCQAGKNTSEMLEQTFATSSAAMSTGEKCDKSGMLKSEALEQITAKSSAAMCAFDEKIDKASGSTSISGKISEETLSKSTAMHSNIAMSASDEKFDLFDNATTAMSTSEVLEKSCAATSASEKSCAATSASEKSCTATSTSEKAGLSKISKSEMLELTSMASKTSESIECLTSYKTSMTSNIKEISEDLSDFVSDILCSELDKTLEIKK